MKLSRLVAMGAVTIASCSHSPHLAGRPREVFIKFTICHATSFDGDNPIYVSENSIPNSARSSRAQIFQDNAGSLVRHSSRTRADLSLFPVDARPPVGADAHADAYAYAHAVTVARAVQRAGL